MTHSVEHDAADVRVSVVIPNYNRSDLIEETLRSARAQVPVHVIVVDDCSPESGTRERLTSYRDDGLIDTLILLDENVGMAAAINRGVAASTTEFVQLISNDDRLEPGAIERLVALLDARPSAAAACGAFQCFGASDRYYQPPQFDPWLLLFESRWPACYLLRRAVWEEAGGLSEDSLFEDWNAYLSYADRGYDVEVLDGLVYHYRTTAGESLWKTVRAQYRRQYRILQREYPKLFARERELRRSSPASTREKLAAKPLRLFRLYRPVAATELIIAASRSGVGRWFLALRSPRGADG